MSDGERGERAHERAGPRGVSPRIISWGLFVFVAGSVVGFAALFLITQDLSGSLAGFRRFSMAWALPCLAFASMDWFGGGLRLWLLLQPLDLDVSYAECVRISGATAGLAYLTPSGAGGAPAQLYGLVRQDVSVGRAAASNFASFLVNVTFLTLAGLAAWFLGAADSLADTRLPLNLSAQDLFQWTVTTFAVVTAVILWFGINPRPARAALLKLFGQGERIRTLLRWIHELHGSILVYARSGKIWLTLAVLSGVLHFGGRFLLGWGVLRGFGIEAGFWNIVILHVLLQYLLYFMPTPGGTGVGEVLAPAVMSPFLPGSLLVAYTAVWRFFLTYLTVAAGGGLLLRWLHLDRERIEETISD